MSLTPFCMTGSLSPQRPERLERVSQPDNRAAALDDEAVVADAGHKPVRAMSVGEGNPHPRYSCRTRRYRTRRLTF